MKIIYKQGDLLAAPEIILLHGCNAQGVMGAGVAKSIRNRYPEAYKTYLKGSMELGTITITHEADHKVILNAITQEYYGRTIGRVYVSYDAIDVVFRLINKVCLICTNMVIAMPKIGAGYGGGDWNIISEIIERNSTNFQPVVYEL